MSDFFSKIATGVDNLEDEFLGPDFPYYKFIAKPSDMGMSSEGSLKALTNDIGGIMNYVKLLISGTGKANNLDKNTPLGNQFFLKTGGKCTDYKSGKKVNRSMYINNIPSANIPIISNLSGMKFDEFRGLAPGVMQNMYSINPVKMFGAFMQGTDPLCAEVALTQYDEKGRKSIKNGFVPINELIDLADNSEIPSNKVTKQMRDALKKSMTDTEEGFQNVCDSCKTYSAKEQEEMLLKVKENIEGIENSDDILPKIKGLIPNIYISSITLLFAYILYKYISKKG